MNVILVCYIMLTTADGHELTSQMSYPYTTLVFRKLIHSSLTWYMGYLMAKYNTPATGLYISYTALQKKPITGKFLMLISADIQSF